MITALQPLLLLLQQSGFSPEAIAAAGGGVWAFGSRATGCSTSESDWDVLIVSPEEPPRSRRRAGQLDLVFVGAPSFFDAWRNSELATHVAKYGVWLSGHRKLRVMSDPLAAADRKAQVVGRRVVVLDRLWDALTMRQRQWEALRLRRDLQRSALLASGVGVPPSAWLDAAWSGSSAIERGRLFRGVVLSPRIARALEA